MVTSRRRQLLLTIGTCFAVADETARTRCPLLQMSGKSRRRKKLLQVTLHVERKNGISAALRISQDDPARNHGKCSRDRKMLYNIFHFYANLF